MIATQISKFRNNCTLVAAKEVTGKPDEDIIQAFIKRGWKPNQGAYPDTYRTAIEDLGFETRFVPTVPADMMPYSYKEVRVGRSWWGDDMTVEKCVRNDMTVGAFAKKHKKGTFVVCTMHHAFVIRDGIVVDPNLQYQGPQRRRKLAHAFEVIGAAPSSHITEVTRLKRNADPLVTFCARGRTKLRAAEEAARHYYNEQARRHWQSQQESSEEYVSYKGVRLSELVANTPYTRGDAAWDIRRGRMLVVKP